MELPLSSNATTPSTSSLLDLFIPGYTVFSQMLIQLLGFDPSWLAIALCISVASLRASAYIWDIIFRSFIEEWILSSVHLEADALPYHYVLDFLASRAESNRIRKWEGSGSLGWDLFFDDWDELDDRGIADSPADLDALCLESSQADSPDTSTESSQQPVVQPKRKLVEYTPYYGTYWFRYNGRLFCLSHRRELRPHSEARYTTDPTVKELTISCLSRSADEIKAFVDWTAMRWEAKVRDKTLIHRPRPVVDNEEPNWANPIQRPKRSLKTVVMDPKLKLQVVEDIRSYLSPANARWYGSRGIPYRRGYLLHGPPGTGKSSLCFALAQYFDLKIYIINLLEPDMNERRLVDLFGILPRKCIVLLEDIDTAGVRRDGGDLVNGTNASSDCDDEDSDSMMKIRKGSRNRRQPGSRNDNSSSGTKNRGVSLSGLLNAIDGVASPEGRILVMTANQPEKLDRALLRPGRVDMQIPFTRATKSLAKQMFLQMYDPEIDRPVTIGAASMKGRANASGCDDGHEQTSAKGDGNEVKERGQARKDETANEKEHTTECKAGIGSDLDSLAAQFAEIVPDGKLSPAEIQGLLLMHKRDPQAAVANAEEACQQIIADQSPSAKLKQTDLA